MAKKSLKIYAVRWRQHAAGSWYTGPDGDQHREDKYGVEFITTVSKASAERAMLWGHPNAKIISIDIAEEIEV